MQLVLGKYECVKLFKSRLMWCTDDGDKPRMKHVINWFTDTFTVAFIDNNFDLEVHFEMLLL